MIVELHLHQGLLIMEPKGLDLLYPLLMIWQHLPYNLILKGPESSQVVVGLCPYMCPESERKERETKRDLDRYERLDGERNQTTKFLAIKKKMVNYLLSLLDQPYNDNFLSIYNFLWDRMRAIRMDLRMQHIFNQQAIIMLEQMIRLHIIAIHELCEYKKGKGFLEGFDAHLNIEQMSKTSVELFHMYNDQRKKAINVPTEKEFRGYYALLKLDKHTGYKIRTKALAALHGGLQKNHGIPIAHVVDWLGKEEEDVEGLLEYHGFVLKKYEELYMVKESPFLNGEVDFPTKCAKLVHLKKSKRIIDDVYFEDEQMTELNGETSMGQGILPQTETTIVQAGAPGFSNSKLINEVANEKLKLIGTVTMGQTDLLASRWLLSKLMGSGEENDEVVVSSSHLSIWKKWINRNSSSSKWVNRNSSSEACCLSIIREAMFVHKQPFAYDDIFAVVDDEYKEKDADPSATN
ncbi:hypothetical protein COCNU_01G017900 [Cocos nucifera]|uniref:SAC3/GANP/THP3 conserved domain-containing protein n=1 Tax=Cocos nucifera TaxID=13894 RepID=A0A8K0HWN6_COCNU|nr:hypothetical protein COCNU_01G017900 [Cocos nucifera]